MTETLPAVVENTREIATSDTDSWINVASDVIRLANLIAPTEFVPASLRDSAPATAAAILYGREVGLPPMTALTQTHVIDGRPAMSAEAMRALVLAAGHDIEVVDTTRARCEIRGRRYGREKWTSVAVAIDEFGHLTSNPKKANWKLYPRQMLQARATAELCRLVFPDVIHGFRATEEFDDLDDLEARGDDAPAPTTRVTRARKTTTKKSTPPPVEQAERPAIAGPPLPGEEGYEQASAPSDRGGAADDEAAAVTDGADAPDAPAPVPAGDSGTEESPGGESEGEAADPPGDSEEPPGGPKDRGPRKATRPQLRMIFARLTELNGGEPMSDEDWQDVSLAIVQRRSYADLTHADAKTMIDTLGRVETREDLDAILAATAEKRANLWNEGDRS